MLTIITQLLEKHIGSLFKIMKASFKQFLSGINSQNNMSREDLIEKIRAECSDWIEATRDIPMYKGKKTERNLLNYGFQVDEVRANRAPRDTSRIFNVIFNEAIYQKTKIKNIRSKCSFCIDDTERAGEYGRVFLTFFPNGYNAVAYPGIPDSFDEFDLAGTLSTFFESMIPNSEWPPKMQKIAGNLKTIYKRRTAEVKSLNDLKKWLLETLNSMVSADNQFTATEISDFINMFIQHISSKYVLLKSGQHFPENMTNTEIMVCNVDKVYLFSRYTENYKDIFKQLYRK